MRNSAKTTLLDICKMRKSVKRVCRIKKKACGGGIYYIPVCSGA